VGPNLTNSRRQIRLHTISFWPEDEQLLFRFIVFQTLYGLSLGHGESHERLAPKKSRKKRKKEPVIFCALLLPFSPQIGFGCGCDTLN
jgi:hypothetical protein